MNMKKWIAKNGLQLLSLLLTGVTTIITNKTNEKAMEEAIKKRVDEVLTNKAKGS